ncbi:phytoene desaturase family protein [Primorskyibacter sp. S87]|uniref:phytoene desaturase family protein n=1 Tax=Primorskyibacter sp. S87 TaxID=3415126 RepID=UPI003C7EC48A
MSRYDAIVVGGGVNGLVAGTILARRGMSVCIVEQADHFGGMAAYSLNGGPPLAHSLYNLSPRVLKDIGLSSQDAAFSGQTVATVSLSDNGQHIVVDGSRASSIDGNTLPESQALKTLLDSLVSYGELLRQLAEAPPPGGSHALVSRDGLSQLLRLAKLGLGLKRLGKPKMRRFLQILLSNVYDLILDELPDGQIAGLLAADAVRGAAAGPRSPGTVFNLIYRLGHGGIVSLPHGGMSAVTDLLAKAASDSDCVLMPDSTISRILTTGDSVSGIELTTGETVRAPLVLSSIAPQQTFRLTGTGMFDIEASRRIRNIRARGTTAKVNFKLPDGAPLPGLPADLSGSRLVYAPSAEYVETAFNPAKYREMSDAPVIEAVRTVSSDGSHWLSTIVQYAPSDIEGGWTDAKQDRLGRLTLETLNRTLPGLSDLVKDRQVITPDLIETATGAPGGHWHHAEMSLDQLLTLRPANGIGRYAMGPKGLFLCGATTHPGGDVMGLAGRNAALAALEGQR